MRFPVGIQIKGDGTVSPAKPDFTDTSYGKRVSLREWWKDAYIILISGSRFSKEEIVLDLAQN
jgi:hypothetical protein